MIKSAGKYIAASLLFLAFLTVFGYFTFTRQFNISHVISVFSIFGFAVLLFYLWHASVRYFTQKRKRAWMYFIFALTVFFSYFTVNPLNRFLGIAAFLAIAAGIFAALRQKKIALLCGLADTVCFAGLLAQGFWFKQISAPLVYTIIFAAVAVYLRVFPILKKE